MRYLRIDIFVIVMGLSGCSAHNPLIIKNTTNINNLGVVKYPSHNKRIFVTNENLPATTKYKVLGSLEVGKVWYGSSNNVIQSLADRARKLGANAVVGVKTWHQPSGFSWAAPHGSGRAVKAASADLANLNGEWR